jgi:hypothetical protein
MPYREMPAWSLLRMRNRLDPSLESITPCAQEQSMLAQIPITQRRTVVEKVNRTAEVEQEQKVVARKPWQTPVVEELPVNQSEASLRGGSSDLGIYS